MLLTFSKRKSIISIPSDARWAVLFVIFDDYINSFRIKFRVFKLLIVF